ncbi:MAG: hypothetical protein AW07_00948 [Candidatus Accumulibacter sp. SK-11]|nr:MAG: hypothetical protein AW07_00948 [Candidatus Accumulibacter sp. SK-11]
MKSCPASRARPRRKSRNIRVTAGTCGDRCRSEMNRIGRKRLAAAGLVERRGVSRLPPVRYAHPRPARHCGSQTFRCVPP